MAVEHAYTYQSGTVHEWIDVLVYSIGIRRDSFGIPPTPEDP